MLSVLALGQTPYPVGSYGEPHMYASQVTSGRILSSSKLIGGGPSQEVNQRPVQSVPQSVGEIL